MNFRFVSLCSVFTSLWVVGLHAADRVAPLAYRLQRTEIMDNNGFGRSMPAIQLLIPAGWSASGGVVWEQRQATCGKNPTRFEWRAVAPDGISAIEVLPEESWSGNNLPMPPVPGGCPNVTINNIRDYLRWYAERNRQGARLLDYRDRPDLTANLQAYNRSDPGPFGETRTWVQAGEILLGYQVNGRDVREEIVAIVLFNLSRMKGVMPGEVREFLIISMLPALSARAPRGELDFHLTETVRRSMKTNPEWKELMDDHSRKMAGIAAKGEADRHAIRMQTAKEIAEIQRQGYENTQATNDRIHERFTQTIRGVETYVDTTSRERIELPNTHQHAWRLNDGTYVLTDDPNFQPNRDLGVEGRQLQNEK